jgi:hypothetical protein
MTSFSFRVDFNKIPTNNNNPHNHLDNLTNCEQFCPTGFDVNGHEKIVAVHERMNQ